LFLCSGEVVVMVRVQKEQQDLAAAGAGATSAQPPLMRSKI
jgi:hypothetical protein